MKSKRMRKTYKFIKGQPRRIAFERLKKGDEFYLEESGGDLMVDDSGKFIYLATSNIDKLPNKNYAIMAEAIA